MYFIHGILRPEMHVSTIRESKPGRMPGKNRSSSRGCGQSGNFQDSENRRLDLNKSFEYTYPNSLAEYS